MKLLQCINYYRYFRGMGYGVRVAWFKSGRVLS
jgi:hypothetical protein